MPNRNGVISTRDVTFNETTFYSQDDLNLSAQLKESVDQIPEIIEIPDIQDNPDIELGPDSDDEEEVGDTIVVRAHTPEPRGESEQPIEENQPAKPPTLPTLEDTPEPVHSAPREIMGNADPIDVVQESRTRRPTEKSRRQAYGTRRGTYTFLPHQRHLSRTI